MEGIVNSSLEINRDNSPEEMIDEGNKSYDGGESCPLFFSGEIDPSLLETHILYA